MLLTKDETTAYLVEDYKQDFSNIQAPIAQKQFPQTEIIAQNNSNVLSNEEYSGPYEFEVTVIPNHKSKNPWVYSPVLNKVFMDMGHQFPVDFKIKDRPTNEVLYIRITPQYSLPQHAQETVHRCIMHDHPMDPTNKGIPDHVRSHVIRCLNSECQYLGNKDYSERLSLVFPFSQPQIGSESVREMFQFVCKSSCASPGMNRRAIEVIFTLESESGKVVGRKCLNVRICACPKRDKEKEEKEHHKDKYGGLPKGKKRKLDGNTSSGKIIMNPEKEFKEYSVNLKIVGKQNLLKILNYAEDLLEAQCYRNQNNGSGGDLPFKKNLLDIQSLKQNLN
ncbi:cellular tumor antigen p53 isoform X2 [Cylas formicarius]|uniref:cellular tumor antigen p53 isoform X2 n=1 Tax=Cylas formicarius TaxID=197179 RepID=UPI0029584C42|nr:cellular tumor antigen p53 isoform X2 [Cylas formicarius]